MEADPRVESAGHVGVIVQRVLPCPAGLLPCCRVGFNASATNFFWFWFLFFLTLAFFTVSVREVVWNGLLQWAQRSSPFLGAACTPAPLHF